LPTLFAAVENGTPARCVGLRPHRQPAQTVLAIARADLSRAFCVTRTQILLCAAVDRVADDQFDRVIGYTWPAPLSDSVGRLS
jgi:hypothetical protein